MSNPIRVGVLGFGNLGKGVLLALQQNPDMELCGVFTRRDPAQLTDLPEGTPVYKIDELMNFREKLDVLILCGGSATDLPRQTPEYAKYFNVVDSFDTHAKIPEHFAACDAAAKESGHITLISVGWDPGLFSLQRLWGECVLPVGSTYTFWGKGVSQGHSDAIRRIEGVVDARQYTVPVEEAMERVRSGENPTLTTREKHTRECYVVAAEDADKEAIRTAIVTMPNYFADYDTTVHFISQEELDRDHKGLPHGGMVIRSGASASGNKHCVEYSLKLDSNPEFTSSVLVAYARAAVRMQKEGMSGCKTVLDVPPAYLSPKQGAELRKELL